MKLTDEKLHDLIIERMRSDDSVDAPADAIRYASTLFRTRTGGRGPLMRRIAAALQMDLLPGTTVFGERSAGEARARQMLFDSGENAVDLRISKEARGFGIRGQVLGDGFEGGTAVLTGPDEQAIASAEIDLAGEFGFQKLSAGTYILFIRGTEHEISAGPIDIS